MKCNFCQLDLNDLRARREYIEQFKDKCDTMILLTRVVGNLEEPTKLFELLTSQLVPGEAGILATGTERQKQILGQLEVSIYKNRPGWPFFDTLTINNGHDAPEQFKTLDHNPEYQARIIYLYAMLDLTKTLNHYQTAGVLST